MRCEDQAEDGVTVVKMWESGAKLRSQSSRGPTESEILAASSRAA